jgi:hypothetical protein
MPGVPELSAVVALLHRADWRRLSLSGVVRGPDESSGLTGATLHVAPGARYRRGTAAYLTGSDGERAWQWRADQAAENEIRSVRSTTAPPYWTLLCPSWLLTGYDLTVVRPTMVCGRAGIRVKGTPRSRVRPQAMGQIFLDRSPVASRDEDVEAIVDAGLGILLWCRGAASGRGSKPPQVEFTELDVPGNADATLYEPPPGHATVTTAKQARRTPTVSWGLEQSGDPFGPAKTIAGLAAGGLGAALRYTPLGWLTKYPDVSSEPMPADDPPPPPSGEDDAQVSDDLLWLLYRSGAVVPRFSASVHSWASIGAAIAGMPDSWRKSGLGGVGYLADWLAGDPSAPRTTHKVSTAQVDGWDRYRIEHAVRVSGHMTDPVLAVGCDGERYWKLHEDRVSAGDARPVPGELADLVDLSWLLGCDLSGGEMVTVDGQPAYRLTARGRWSDSELLLWGCPATVVLDAQTGRLLRVTTYSHGQPVERHELRDVTSGVPQADYSAPPGLRVVGAGSPADHPSPSVVAAKVAGSVASFFRRPR